MPREIHTVRGYSTSLRGPEGAGHFDGGLSAGHFDGPDTKGPRPGEGKFDGHATKGPTLREGFHSILWFVPRKCRFRLDI